MKDKPHQPQPPPYLVICADDWIVEFDEHDLSTGRSWSRDVGVQDQALTKKLRAQRAEIEELKAKLAAADVTPPVTTPVATGGTETRHLKITVRDYDYDLAGELRAYFAESDGYSDDDPFWKVSGVQDVTAEVTAAQAGAACRARRVRRRAESGAGVSAPVFWQSSTAGPGPEWRHRRPPTRCPRSSPLIWQLRYPSPKVAPMPRPPALTSLGAAALAGATFTGCTAPAVVTPTDAATVRRQRRAGQRLPAADHLGGRLNPRARQSVQPDRRPADRRHGTQPASGGPCPLTHGSAYEFSTGLPARRRPPEAPIRTRPPGAQG